MAYKFQEGDIIRVKSLAVDIDGNDLSKFTHRFAKVIGRTYQDPIVYEGINWLCAYHIDFSNPRLNDLMFKYGINAIPEEYLEAVIQKRTKIDNNGNLIMEE